MGAWGKGPEPSVSQGKRPRPTPARRRLAGLFTLAFFVSPSAQGMLEKLRVGSFP